MRRYVWNVPFNLLDLSTLRPTHRGGYVPKRTHNAQAQGKTFKRIS